MASIKPKSPASKRQGDDDSSSNTVTGPCTGCDNGTCTACSPKKARVSGKEVPYIVRTESFLKANAYAISEPTNQSLQKVTRERRVSMRRASVIGTDVLGTNEKITNKFSYPTRDNGLGKGSYGVVCRVKDNNTGQWRALKSIPKEKIENVTRLKREVVIMKRLDHPHIIRLYNVYEDTANLYFSLELCTGGELFDRIIHSQCFNEKAAAVAIKQILSAVAYIHQNDIMHRDLKPENVLYVDANAESLLKVIDWGFAAKCGVAHSFTSVVGTPYYVAPEVLFGNYTKTCDIWSCGVILYILLCGYPPFFGNDNKEILRKVKIGEYVFDPKHWKHISEHGKDMVRRLLTYNPKKRPPANIALTHPWVAYYTSLSATTPLAMTPKLGHDLADKFKKFASWPMLRRLAVTVCAYITSYKDIGMLTEVYLTLDRDFDGVLTYEDLENALTGMEVQVDDSIRAAIEGLDTDGNGTIDYTEFVAAGLDPKRLDDERLVRHVFRMFAGLKSETGKENEKDASITVVTLQEMLGCLASEAESMIAEVTDRRSSLDFNDFWKIIKGPRSHKSPILKARSIFTRGSAAN